MTTTIGDPRSAEGAVLVLESGARVPFRIRRSSTATPRKPGRPAAARSQATTAQPSPPRAAADQARAEGADAAREETRAVLAAAAGVGATQGDAVELLAELGLDGALDALARHGSRALERARFDADAEALWASRGAASSEADVPEHERAAVVTTDADRVRPSGAGNGDGPVIDAAAIYARRARQARGEE